MVLTFIGTFIGVFILTLVVQPLLRFRQRFYGDFAGVKPKDNTLLKQHMGKQKYLWAAAIALAASALITLSNM